MKINDILTNKGAEIVTISPDATVGELVKLLVKHNIGALVVSRDGKTLDGIVSERDVVHNLSDDRELSTQPVSAIMTSDVFCCGPDNDLDQLRTEMTERRVRHVPVVRDSQLAGIVSIGDVVKSAISELQFERDQLSNYLNQ